MQKPFKREWRYASGGFCVRQPRSSLLAMESIAESAERSEMELRNSDYDYSRFAVVDVDDLETCLSELSAALGSISIYSLPPSEIAVEPFSGLSEGLYSQYSATPSEADVEMPADGAAFRFPLTSAPEARQELSLYTAIADVSELATAEELYSGLETAIEEASFSGLETANEEASFSGLETANEEASFSVYSLPPSETAVEMNDALYPQALTGAAPELTHDLMALAPDAAIPAPVARDSIYHGFPSEAPIVKVAPLEYLLQTGVSDLDTAVDLLESIDALSEYSVPSSEVGVEMPEDPSTLSFPLTSPMVLASAEVVDSAYALDELNASDEAQPLQFRRCSQYAEGELRDFQAWHEDNKLDNSVAVDPKSSQFVQMPLAGATKMFASTASEYCVDNVG
ncbi:hypothetical protein QR680_013247 [Steinernema hermaphroditum]|uniref:Uncharacterized protein n=1 Tax=Steinernema hermaphroditum TaxID=289476 RepID=A0AA39I4V3_9BILA|nr:hypothetical protein QR680_013247 [Steinernema hermaphroditum]